MKNSVESVDIFKFKGKQVEALKDLVATEEPLEIRLKYYDGIEFKEKRLAVTMRTPGNDFELAIGFLLTEGIIQTYAQVNKIFYCEEVKPEEAGNVIVVHLTEEVQLDASVFNRNFYVNSSCGVCGKSSIESIESICSVTPEPGLPVISVELIQQIPGLAREAQSVFKHTGGLHASALFDTEGRLLMLREDIGRHNALDKLTGARAIEDKSNKNTVLLVSGRSSFELIQKAVMAGIPVVIGVGAPSSLAVDLAKRNGLTLIGFAREDRFNVYCDFDRIAEFKYRN